MNADFPFSIDRTSAVPLVQQVADGCRNAIVTGDFPVGEMIPSLGAMAAGLGVSLKVVRSAYERLSREGWLLPRNGIGYLAKNSGVPVWKGSALLVYDNNSYSMRTNADALQKGLERRGYLVDCVKVDKFRRERSHDLERLKARLFKRYDMAFTYAVSAEIAELLGSLKCPVFATSRNAWRYKGLTGIRLEDSSAYEALIRICKSEGVKSIELVDFHGAYSDLDERLRSCGFRVGSVITPYDNREDAFFASIRRGARDLFRKRIRHDRKHLPDLFLFLDDYVLTGALAAFSESGIRIPEDLKLVTVCNRGNEPCWAKELSSLSHDQRRLGESVAELMADWIEGSRRPLKLDAAVEFVRGATF